MQYKANTIQMYLTAQSQHKVEINWHSFKNVTGKLHTTLWSSSQATTILSERKSFSV